MFFPRSHIDFVSRFFAPRFGIDEVTGSSHCCLTPFWASRLDKTVLTARQLSSRGGELEGERVKLRGTCGTTLRGNLTESALSQRVAWVRAKARVRFGSSPSTEIVRL